jgi:hypothetical protein
MNPNTMNTRFTLKTLSGIAMLSCILLMAGCSKEKNNQPGTTNNNSPYYVAALLGGQSITIKGPSNPYVDTVTVFLDSNGHQIIFGNVPVDSNNLIRRTQYISSATWTNAVSPGAPNSVVQASIQILKKLSVRVYVAPIPAPASSTIYSMLTENMTLADDDDPSDGVIVSIRDSDGVLWTSLGHQSHSSSFQINSIGQNMGSYAIITGSVTASMYDGNGNVKQLTSTAFNAMIGL